MKKNLLVLFLIISASLFPQSYLQDTPVKYFNNYLSQNNSPQKNNLKTLITLGLGYYSEKDTLTIQNFDKDGNETNFINFEKNKRNRIYNSKKIKNITETIECGYRDYTILSNSCNKRIYEYDEKNPKILKSLSDIYDRKLIRNSKYFYTNSYKPVKEEVYNYQNILQSSIDYNYTNNLLSKYILKTTSETFIKGTFKTVKKIIVSNEVTYLYDKNNNMTDVISKQSEIQDAYHFTYDEKNKVIKEKYDLDTPETDPVTGKGKIVKKNGEISYFYNSQGKINRILETSEEFGKIESEIIYDENGNNVKIINTIKGLKNFNNFRYFHSANKNVVQEIIYQYNEKNDLIKSIIKEGKNLINNTEYIREYY